MFISDFAIRKPIITVVTMLALVVFGLAALMLLKTDEFPDVQPPIVVVSVLYPGAAPENVEREVIEPIEDVVSGISGVSQIQSSALDSFAVFIIQFAYEKDLQEATQQIRDEVNAIRNDLPPEMEEPVLTRFDPADLPVVSLVLASPTVSGPELTLLADPGVVRRLRGLQGVAQAKVVGGIERELTVELRPQALQASGVGVAQVVGALQAQNLSAPVGRLLGSLDERTIRLRGRLAAPADFERLVISESNGRLVRLGDVAAVRDGTEEPRSAAIFNGSEAVGIEIVKSKGYSTTAVAQAIRDEVGRLQKTLPPGTSLRIVRDAGTRVAQSVGDVEYALVEGAVLTVLVVFLFLNSWRSTVITGIALPISVIASFIAVLAFVLEALASGVSSRGAFVFVSYPTIIAGTLGGLFGALFDSVLGATVQAMYYCDVDQKETESAVHRCGNKTRLIRGWEWLDNDWVNFLSSIFGSLVALLVYLVVNPIF